MLSFNLSLIKAWIHLTYFQRQRVSKLAIRSMSRSLDKLQMAGLGCFCWPGLRHLDLSHNRLDPAAIAELGQRIAGHCGHIRVLNLSNTCLITEAVRHLVKVDWPYLQKLHLDANRMVDAEGVLLLSKVACCQWPQLICLSLCGVNMTASSVKTLTLAYCGRRRCLRLG